MIDTEQRRHAGGCLHAALDCVASVRDLLRRELARPADMPTAGALKKGSSTKRLKLAAMSPKVPPPAVADAQRQAEAVALKLSNQFPE